MKPSKEIKDIENIARKVRAAIEEEIATSKYTNDIELQSFPRGSCEVATVILGLFLIQAGYEKTIQHAGLRRNINGSENYHVWLFVNDQIIVDITADQFQECTSKIIVETRSKLHDSFPVYQKRPLNLEALDRNGMANYRNLYNEILHKG